MKEYIDRFSELDLISKKVSVFGTYAGNESPFDGVVKELEKMVPKKLLNSTLMSVSL